MAAQVDPVTRGDIGWFPRGYLTEKAVEDAAFSLEAGKYSAIIPGEVGFHIIKTLELQADRPLSPDALLALQKARFNGLACQSSPAKQYSPGSITCSRRRDRRMNNYDEFLNEKPKGFRAEEKKLALI